MDFVARVLSGSGRLKDRAKDVDELNRVFKANQVRLARLLKSKRAPTRWKICWGDVLDCGMPFVQDSVKKIVEKDGSELHAFLDMIYDSSFPEEKVGLKLLLIP